ncbi:MAG: hypothetical protein RBT65_13990 [Methanolobus sp.]|jgi:hypothetical protein|nr:hypothetical protein [Methanolobus sp.]
MKTKKVLLTGILLGIILFGIFSLLDIDSIYGGIVSAILVGIIIGKMIAKNPVKYAFISIFIYNIIGWILIFLFTSEGQIIIGHSPEAAGIFVGFVIITTIFYSIIGSFSAFVAYNLKTNKQE